MTVDFIDLHWVITALFMRVDLFWKMELSCIRMRNWVREGLADFSFSVWVGGFSFTGVTLKLCDPQSY